MHIYLKTYTIDRTATFDRPIVSSPFVDLIMFLTRDHISSSRMRMMILISVVLSEMERMTDKQEDLKSNRARRHCHFQLHYLQTWTCDNFSGIIAGRRIQHWLKPKLMSKRTHHDGHLQSSCLGWHRFERRVSFCIPFRPFFNLNWNKDSAFAFNILLMYIAWVVLVWKKWHVGRSALKLTY